jgi:hypothetical protein
MIQFTHQTPTATATSSLCPHHCRFELLYGSHDTMSHTQEQMDEVWSWIHNDKRCVTTQTVSLAMGLPRSVAASLLFDLSKKKGDYSYECTKLSLLQQNGTTGVSYSNVRLSLFCFSCIFFPHSDSTAQECHFPRGYGRG